LTSEYPTQAVVLAAGLGSRLAPITNHTPKPLIPFFTVAMLELAVAKLSEAGVTRIAVNAKHLASKVCNFVEVRLGPAFPKMEFHVSVEDEVLGTGGALRNLHSWLGKGSFWVVNSDAVFAQSLTEVAERHVQDGNDATLMVTRADEHCDLRFLRAGSDGLLRERMPEASEEGFAFCGVHLNEPGLFDHLPRTGESCVLRAGHLPWVRSGGRVGLYETKRFWADAGTPDRYLKAHRRALPTLESWFPVSTS
jgi:mannose-1-phosphate guanylyltransferase